MTAARLRGIHVAVAGDDTDALTQLAQSLKRDGALVTAHDSARGLARVMEVARAITAVFAAAPERGPRSAEAVRPARSRMTAVDSLRRLPCDC